jgi:putative membrane protein
MYVRRNIRASLILSFAWKNILLLTAWAVLVTGAFGLLQPHGIDLRLPFLPISTIGIAVSFYLGFKNSQSYDRFWEGRKQWGAIVNLCRTWGAQVHTYIKTRHTDTGLPFEGAERHERQHELIYRQLAWANALRQQLRRSTIHDRENIHHTPDLGVGAHPDEPRMEQFLDPAEYAAVMRNANPAAQLLKNQAIALRLLREESLLDGPSHVDMMLSLKDAYGAQGACERIKNTPFPRQYAYFANLFVWAFVLLLPFGMLGEFAKLGGTAMLWLNVPMSVLVSWIFTTFEIVGDNSEDPFENYVNDVPMTALCRTIEIDLREMLNETSLPPRIQPVNDILL